MSRSSRIGPSEVTLRRQLHEVARAQVLDEAGHVLLERGRRILRLGPHAVHQVGKPCLVLDQPPDQRAELVQSVIGARLEVQEYAPLLLLQRAKYSVRVASDSSGRVDHA